MWVILGGQRRRPPGSPRRPLYSGFGWCNLDFGDGWKEFIVEWVCKTQLDEERGEGRESEDEKKNHTSPARTKPALDIPDLSVDHSEPTGNGRMQPVSSRKG